MSLGAIAARERFFPGLIGFFVNPNFIVRRKLAQAIARHSGKFHGRVLDFGCGSKPYRRLFEHAESYVGVDIEQSGHDHASSDIDIFYDGTTLPFGDASFDAAVSFETFEHVPDIDRMLGELARVITPGGLLLVSTPFAFPEHETPFDFRRLTRFGWTRLIEAHGFEAVDVRTTGGYVLTLVQLWQTYVKSLARGSRAATTIFNLVVGVPALAIGFLADAVLPRSDRLYLNIVVLARRTGSKIP